MNNSARLLYKPASGWDIERRRFRDLLARWVDYHLNIFFDLNIQGPKVRRYWILALGAGFIAAGFIVHAILFYFPILATARQFQSSGLLLFFILTILRLVIILLIPSYIAITMAGNYLSDIFELKNPTIAWNYIRELSLGGANELIHIRDGKISEESLNSPILLIGGPGRVLVEFDSAALFEKPDGTPHVIGLGNAKPEPGINNYILSGFERLREPVINLREQYVGGPSGDSMTVLSRSLDGITVSAADVKAVFSIRRVTDEASADLSNQTPYPFDPQDIEKLIYKQALPVLTEGLYPSGLPPQWTRSMQGLIRASLSEFMNQNNLAEYLASIGTAELELSELREDTILSQTIQSTNELPETSSQSVQKPRFHPRTELSDRFTRYSGGFSREARERGLELHWIGVGTWQLPGEISREIINDQHLEAWRLNQENASRTEAGAVQSIADEAYLAETVRLIKDVPLAAHQRNLAKYSSKDVLVECLFQNYWEQLGDALDTYYKSAPDSPELEMMEKAVLIMERLLRIPTGQHMIGGGSMSSNHPHTTADLETDAPPAPASRAEAEQYGILLGKLEGNYRVVEGMLANEARRYPSLGRVELIKRIVSRFERYGR